MTKPAPELIASLSTINRNIADNLRRLRLQRGWSVRRLADECAKRGASQLTEASLGNIERGQDPDAKRKPRDLSAGELVILTCLFGVSTGFLVSLPTCPTCSGQPPAGFTCNACGAGGEHSAADLDAPRP